MKKTVAVVAIVMAMVLALGLPATAQVESSSSGFWPSPEVPLADYVDAADVVGIVSASNYDRSLDAPVLRLYQAYFNRQPDTGGAKYWLGIRRQGFGLLDIAGFMAGSEEFANTYAGTSNDAYVAQVYANVLGRAYDQDGYDYWLDLLDTNQTTRVTTVFYVTANAEFINNHPYTTQPPAELTDAAENYFAAVAADASAMGFAQGGSPAMAYATYLVAVSSAYGGTDIPLSATFDGTAAVLVFEGDLSIQYDNIVTNANGVVSFNINGTPLEELMLYSETPQSVAKVTIEYVSAYRSASGGLLVFARIRNNGSTNLEVAAYNTAWVSAEGGNQFEPEEYVGSQSIRPGAVGTVIINFGLTGSNTSAGTIYFESFLNDFVEQVSYSATLPT